MKSPLFDSPLGAVAAPRFTAPERVATLDAACAEIPAGASGRAHEEFANAASHAVGVVMACAALPTLVLDVGRSDPARLAGSLVFVLTMLLVFLASSIFHALPVGRAKALLRRIDHAAIFLFIAGSFTPFVLAARSPVQGLWLLAAIWAMAGLGVALKLVDRLRHRSLSTLLYLMFGWAVVAAAQPMLLAMDPQGLRLLVFGGVAYNVGCVFYLLDRRLPYGHLVWHLFVLLGSGAHFLAVMRYAA